MSTKLLNQENIIKKVYDPPTQSLKVTGTSVIAPGQMEVAISDVDDSIKIGDGSGDYLNVNPDGSINVNVVSSAAAGTGINKYNEVLAIASGADMTINSYIVPVGKTATISLIEVSGENIARYTVKIDGLVQARSRSYFGGNLNLVFEFKDEIKLIAGQIITVEVFNFRPESSDFNSRIMVVEY